MLRITKQAAEPIYKGIKNHYTRLNREQTTQQDTHVRNKLKLKNKGERCKGKTPFDEASLSTILNSVFQLFQELLV